MNTAQPQLAFPFNDDSHVALCDSVAERQVLFALFRAGWYRVEPANDVATTAPMLVHPDLPTTVCFQQFDLQHTIGVKHRADFAFRDFFADVCLVVEVDGERYHNTATQVARDKRLDRLVNSRRGWVMHRYLAAEVLRPRAADAVVDQVGRLLQQWHRRTQAFRTALAG